MDIDATFALELTRRAAHYLTEHLEHPGQALPAGADDLAHLVAELVIGAGDLAADPAALEIERLQLEKNRLDREIAAAQRAGEPVTALASGSRTRSATSSSEATGGTARRAYSRPMRRLNTSRSPG